ncbi:hypothetical protein ACFFX0_10620 [Citricoccus parietis]|uniref:Secreted protein n=1 Tax=Citricoccus parietis TaxID=592307 RepID=A0ABV5FY96_9MICC
MPASAEQPERPTAKAPAPSMAAARIVDLLCMCILSRCTLCVQIIAMRDGDNNRCRTSHAQIVARVSTGMMFNGCRPRRGARLRISALRTQQCGRRSQLISAHTVHSG